MTLPLRDDSPLPRRPWVTWALIILNVFVFLLLQPAAFQGGAVDLEDESAISFRELLRIEEFLLTYGVIPCEVDDLESIADGADCDHPYGDDLPDKNVLFSLLSAMFVHGGVLHLVGNMLFLWVFGRAVESRLGAPAFIGMYLITGLAATLTFCLFHAGEAEPVIGASGAISGAMGAYLVLHPNARILTVIPGLVFQVVLIPAYVVLGLFFVTQFFVPDIAQVAWEAHVGGMATGALVALGLARAIAPPPLPPTRQVVPF